MERSRAFAARPRRSGGAIGRSRPIAWLAPLLIVLFAAALPAKAQPSFESIVAQFEEVAFGDEHGNTVEIIRKWTRSPDLALFRRPNYDIRPYLEGIDRHLRAIGKLTGIPVHVADVPSEATLRLGFYPRSDFNKMPGDRSDPEFVRWISTSACLALAIADQGDAGSITGGAIAIGTDIPAQQREHCILEELVQVLGLPNDACHYRPSLFCEHDRVFELTAADRILVRTLYDPRLLPGTPKKTAMPTVRTIVAELMPTLIREN